MSKEALRKAILYKLRDEAVRNKLSVFAVVSENDGSGGNSVYSAPANNKHNEAVKLARRNHTAWEVAHGHDPHVGESINKKASLVKIKVLDGDKVLQHHFVRANKWGLPAGRVDEGETMQEGAARELLERTGYKVDPKNLREAGTEGPHKVFVTQKNHLVRKGYPGQFGGYKTKIRWSLNKQAEIKYKMHQKRVAAKLQKQRGLVAYHGLGSGKTLTAINAAEQFGGAVVITPASLRDNFKKELVKSKANGKYDIYSYEGFIRNPVSLKDRVLILDEAHRIRSAGSKRSQIIREKAKEAKKVLLLTGTPIQNKPHEISPLINTITGKNTLPISESDFKKKYLDIIKTDPGFFRRVFKKDKNLKPFRRLVKKHIDYYSPDKNIEDFPNKKEHLVNVEMSNNQRDIYKTWTKELTPRVRKLINKRLPPSKQDAVELNAFANVFRQVANSGKEFDILNNETPPKVKVVGKKIKRSKGPALVYSNYIKSGLGEVSKELSKKKINHALYTGSLNDKQKKQIVKDYNDQKLKALLVSSSGGEGLDLKRTRQVHVLEPHWNDPKIEQVIGRAARYKSHADLPVKDRKVDIYRYNSILPKNRKTIAQYLLRRDATRDPAIEEYLATMSKTKKDLNEKFLKAMR